MSSGDSDAKGWELTWCLNHDSFPLECNMDKMSVVTKLWIPLNAVFKESDLTECEGRSCWRLLRVEKNTINCSHRSNLFTNFSVFKVMCVPGAVCLFNLCYFIWNVMDLLIWGNIILVNMSIVETFLKLLKISYMKYDSHYFSMLPLGCGKHPVWVLTLYSKPIYKCLCGKQILWNVSRK